MSDGEEIYKNKWDGRLRRKRIDIRKSESGKKHARKSYKKEKKILESVKPRTPSPFRKRSVSGSPTTSNLYSSPEFTDSSSNKRRTPEEPVSNDTSNSSDFPRKIRRLNIDENSESEDDGEESSKRFKKSINSVIAVNRFKSGLKSINKTLESNEEKDNISSNSSQLLKKVVNKVIAVNRIKNDNIPLITNKESCTES